MVDRGLHMYNVSIIEINIAFFQKKPAKKNAPSSFQPRRTSPASGFEHLFFLRGNMWGSGGGGVGVGGEKGERGVGVDKKSEG